MYDAKLKPGSSLDKMREVFCLGYFTGQRYSDVASMRRDDIKGELRSVKADRAHQVPLNVFALAILRSIRSTQNHCR